MAARLLASLDVSAHATVVVPTHSHATTLPFAVRSALRQTLDDLDVVILGDGVDEATRAAAQELAEESDRVRFVDRPKGERHGELHRHELLTELATRNVLYLSDDDLWLPEHAARMVGLLESGADAAGARFVSVSETGQLALCSVDLAAGPHRDLMLGDFNRVGLSGMAHTADAYRRLPHGWRTTPRGTPTDLHMWRQFIGEPWVTFASAPAVTVLNFPSIQRADQGDEERAAELRRYEAVTRDPVARGEFFEQLLIDEFPRASWLETHYLSLEEWNQRLQEALEWHQRTLRETLEWHQAELARTREALAVAEAHQPPTADASPVPAQTPPRDEEPSGGVGASGRPTSALRRLGRRGGA
jgi:hypothetical protein